MKKIYLKLKQVLSVSLLFVSVVGINATTWAQNQSVGVPNGSNPKMDVWDFGAVQLDSAIYENHLNVEVINGWYAETIAPGSSGNVLPSFTSGILTWTGGGNDRLRTTNKELTRYDENIGGATGYTGRIYVNSAAATTRYLSLDLNPDDEVTLVTRSDAGGILNFVNDGNPDLQTDRVEVSDLKTVKFVAQTAGTYKVFDTQGKPSYYRIVRKPATYATLSGTIDVAGAPGISPDFRLQFVNEAGKSWNADMTTTGYSVSLPQGYNYTVRLRNANGYVISSEKLINVVEPNVQFNVSLLKVQLQLVSGSVLGLGDRLSKAKLGFSADTAAHSIFVPEPILDVETGTYSVQLEPKVAYTISAEGVNDFEIQQNTLTIAAEDTSFDIQFQEKTKFPVTIQSGMLAAEQLAKLKVTFSNLNEAGYVYEFASIEGIQLRNGTYTVAVSGLDAWPLQLALTSNLKVEGAAVSKELRFEPVSNWSFNDRVIANGATAYKGMLFTGNVANEQAKGHLTAKPGATVQIPVKPNQKVRIAYYYAADFSIDGGDAISTSSGSTSKIETTEYKYTGTEAGFVTLTVGSGVPTTYLTDVTLLPVVEFASVLKVGIDKPYKTINEALTAVANMERPNNERVTIEIDPGNYEEMLVIDRPNITLKNASAAPSIALLNQGVDIDANAVRITSYYGLGYNYYSMHNQKWNADVLRVNKENGYLSYENQGGTTNGSYWNATLVVQANGFVAENLIIENSFNQYISKKESEDVVVMWEVGSKGQRPTDVGNTSVQKRSFVERAAAIAIPNNTDKVILNRCRIVGRQDSFFGGNNSRVVVYKGAVMGAVDYLFGGMTAVFYKTDLVMNVSDDSNDASYLTAAQQSSGRGYLMYNCHVKSAQPGVETASTMLAKPGYFGRPWLATTSEVVFFNTTIDTTNYTGYKGKSMISPAAWTSSLGGESNKMYEYGTVELSGENNQSKRASWSTVLTEPKLTDGTEITCFNFTKGTDGWDPIAELLAADPGTSVGELPKANSVRVRGYGNALYFDGINSETRIQIYTLNGAQLKPFTLQSNSTIEVGKGIWIVRVETAEGVEISKVVTR